MIAFIWVLHNDVAHNLSLRPMIAFIWVLHNDVAHKHEFSTNQCSQRVIHFSRRSLCLPETQISLFFKSRLQCLLGHS
jgi:hypothetical protein